MRESKSKILEEYRIIDNKLDKYEYSNMEEKEKLEDERNILLQKLRELKRKEVKKHKKSNKIEYRTNIYNKSKKIPFEVTKKESKPIEVIEPIPPEEINNSFKEEEVEIIEPIPLDPASFNQVRRYLILNGNRITLKEYEKETGIKVKKARDLFEKWEDLDLITHRSIRHNKFEYYIEGLLTK